MIDDESEFINKFYKHMIIKSDEKDESISFEKSVVYGMN